MDGHQRLVLFDVDCTLIDGHGAGGQAILRAVLETYGVSGELGEYSYHGRTDPGIVRDLAAMWGVPDDHADALVDECLARYTTYLREEIDERLIEVLPGVRQLVAALAADERVLLGLLTGNVEDGARAKLHPTGLWPFFKVAAYGSDAHQRPRLPAIAVARAERLVGHRYFGKHVVIIGDTPADVACGQDLGVKAVGVATGRHSLAELAAAGADHVFADFSRWRVAFEAIVA